MLSEVVKNNIQTAYRVFLQKKQLKPREGQKQMIAQIARSLGQVKVNKDNVRINETGIAVVEAGTGTGKTVAYLLASIGYALTQKKTVIVSTATIALQEQILLKDLPDVLSHSGLNFTYMLAKGRRRYVCLLKLDQLLQVQQGLNVTVPMFEESMTADEKDASAYQQLLEDYGSGRWNGEYESLQTPIPTAQWNELTSNHQECTHHRCAFFQNCALYKARAKLDQADVIVANHDLVMSDLAMGGGAILSQPKDSIYVVDEAHHLCDKALDHFSAELAVRGNQSTLDNFKNSLPKLQPVLALEYKLAKLSDKLQTHTQLLAEYLLGLRHLLESMLPTTLESTTLRIPPDAIDPGLMQQIELLKSAYLHIVESLTLIQKTMKDSLSDQGNEISRDQAEAWLPLVGKWLFRFEASFQLCLQFSSEETGVPNARWIERLFHHDFIETSIHCSPIMASSLLEHYFWQKSYAVVLTSATLTVGKRFDRLTKQAGIPDYADYAVVSSPFQYPRQVRFCVPKQAVEANNAEAHTENLIEQIPKLLGLKKANLVLFASRKQMNEVYDGLNSQWQEVILKQSQSPKNQLLTEHRQRIDQHQGSTLFGLASFAEGVDLPGEYLTHLMIAKIPFVTPDDPISAQLSEWVESNGGNAFMSITVPDAAVKLVQACGRLIRTEQDTGFIFLMDQRINSKRYGAVLLNSLPDFG